MSKRPEIESRREKQEERRIQKARRERDRAMKASRDKRATRRQPEPFILSHGRGPVEPAKLVPAGARAWIESESKGQLGHYRRIFREQERLAPSRRKWVAEFFERITGPRGFSVHA